MDKFQSQTLETPQWPSSLQFLLQWEIEIIKSANWKRCLLGEQVSRNKWVRDRILMSKWQWMCLPCFLCSDARAVVFSAWFRMAWLRFCFQILWPFRLCCPKNMSQKPVQEICPRILVKNCFQETCPAHMSKFRNMFNRNLSKKRGKEMTSRRDMSNKSLMGEGAPPS